MIEKVTPQRIALVTGASSGIGKESARLLSQAGFAVGLLGRRLETLQELQQEITQAGGQAWSEALDIRDEAAVTLLSTIPWLVMEKSTCLFTARVFSRWCPLSKQTQASGTKPSRLT